MNSPLISIAALNYVIEVVIGFDLFCRRVGSQHFFTYSRKFLTTLIKLVSSFSSSTWSKSVNSSSKTRCLFTIWQRCSGRRCCTVAITTLPRREMLQKISWQQAPSMSWLKLEFSTSFWREEQGANPFKLLNDKFDERDPCCFPKFEDCNLKENVWQKQHIKRFTPTNECYCAKKYQQKEKLIVCRSVKWAKNLPTLIYEKWKRNKQRRHFSLNFP